MADISKITLLDGTTYNFKDAEARNSIPASATTTPKMDGTAAVGSSTKYAKEDHVHPVDTSRAPVSHTHSANDIATIGYLKTHPENAATTIIPFIHNDLSFLTKRGGSAVVSYDGVIQSVDISSVFDGSATYWVVNSANMSTIVVELTLHQVFTYTSKIYVDFGSNNWRSKSVKIEAKNSNYADDVWSEKYSTTTNSISHVYVNTSHTPVGAANSGAGFNMLRFTFSNWQTSSGSGFRISQIGVLNFGSKGVRETYMSRGIDDYVYRNITPAANNTYSLGSNSYKWKDVYTVKLNGTTIPESPKFTDTTYESKTAASGGTDVSLVTTGEKATWNGKVNISQGTSNAGKFLVVGSDGNVTTVTMSAWQGGSY